MWGNDSKLRKDSNLCTSDVLAVSLALRPAQGAPAIGNLEGGTASLNTPNAHCHFSIHWLEVGIGLIDSRDA